MAPDLRQDRHEDDVEAGDEPRLSRRRVDDAHLLQGRAQEESGAGENPAAQDAAAAATPTAYPERGDHGGTESEADPVEEEGADVLHAHALRDEGEAPDQRGQQEERLGRQRFTVHSEKLPMVLPNLGIANLIRWILQTAAKPCERLLWI